ncbi:MAG: HsdR family type I site-specific deoxyribonuclease [Bacilli bacterium]|nr:HsdR family type I site-specific deoxyribonuclease [Bacilli bacterium]
MYSDELVFEHDFVEALKQNGWTDGVLNHPTEKDLIDNWARILFENNRQKDRLGDYPLTDTEMQQIIENITALRTPLKLNSFINGKTISIIRDNPNDVLHKGKEISLKIYDRKEIAAGQSRYQIAEQPIFQKSSPILNSRRGDVMLLINGMPLFHVELKKSNISVKQATNQIEKYAHEGIYSGIYSLVQIFVAMTPEETVYFANPGPDGFFNPAFYFHWEDFNNEIINNWKDLTRTLLSIPMAHQLIGFYTVADDTDGVLKVMRSYQYYAANKISDVVSKTDWTNPNIRGGYIWHTTGSGKTMTSFKSAQLIANSKDADKVVFLMDRIELGTQSLSEYQGFADNKDDVAGTEDTKDLITKLKSENPKNTLIVTSIQKMSLIKDVVGVYTHDIEQINKKRIVIIVDECHRDVFGIMMSSIRETFPKAIFFGFTGTPIFDENKKKLSTMPDVFGNELHRYVIADGIRDGNVLGFDLYKVPTFKDIDIRRAVALHKCKAQDENEAINDPSKSPTYYKYIHEISMSTEEDENGDLIKGIEDYIPSNQYNSNRHREQVIKNIMDNWNRISRNNTFSAILATNSIPEAIEYYRLLKSKNANDLFKFTVLVDSNIDNSDGAIFKEDGLIEIISDYNEMYEQNFSLSTSGSFKKDVSNRLAHKKPYNRILENDKLGLLIVVDQMLTGFDSKWLNALYLDKVVQYENIIQAFSRTNRIYKMIEKPFGIIKYYRKPYTMEKNIEKAIKLYSGDKPFQLFVPKLNENLGKMNVIYEELEDLFKSEGIENFSSLPEDNETKRKFVKLYNEFNKYLNASMIQGYVPNRYEEASEIDLTDKLMDSQNSKEEINKIGDEFFDEVVACNSPVSISNINALNQRYKELSREPKEKTNDIPYDIDASLVEIDDGKIDSDYMNSKFTKYLKTLNQENCSKEELETALSNLHKSFASLSKEKQKYANILLNDINSGDIVIESGKTFIDYITEYEIKAENDQIKILSNSFGLDEQKLRQIMSLPLTESNLNEFNRFEDLLKTVNKDTAKSSLEKIYNKELKQYEVSMETHEILRKFILEGGFGLEVFSNSKVD